MSFGRGTFGVGEAGGALFRADVLYFDGATVTQDGRTVTITITGGGGGVTDHADLNTASLVWTAGAHTGTPNRAAGFDGSGAASYITFSSPLSLSGGAVSIDLSAYLTAATAAATYLTIATAASSYQPLDADLTALAALGDGLPVRSAGTWAANSLGDLAINGGSVEVATVGGSSAATVAGQRTAHEGAYDHSLLPTADEKDALAGSSGTPGSTNPYVTSADPRLTGASGGAALAAASEYGTGALGSMTLNGSNTYPSICTLSGSTYTVNAAVVLNAYDLTISAGITLKPAGSPVRVLGTLTLDGTIDLSGSAASGNTAGAGAGPSVSPAVPATGNVYIGGATGTAGMTTNVSGGNSSLLSNSICCGGQGGSGGSGTYGGTSNGGSGTLTASSVQTDHYHGELQWLLQVGRSDGGTFRLNLNGGAGGASGANRIGSGSGTLRSGAGGGGGGIGAVYARFASFGASAQIVADGNTGGNAPYTTPGGNAGSGGGGGGGGGVIFLKVGDVTGTQQLPALYARGGAGGNANSVGAGYASGGNGGNGGKIFCLVANYTGSAPTTANTGGSGGTGSGGSGVSGSSGSAGPTPIYVSL